MAVSAGKQHGVHYTPAKLACFLADQIGLQVKSMPEFACSAKNPLRVLDPACGDGELLIALINALPCPAQHLAVTGFELDPAAADKARDRLELSGVQSIDIVTADFLQPESVEPPMSNFDIVIANPPYVRTQVLGGLQAQALARRFGLTGRVDLYHAFSIAMGQILRPGGVLGLLTSNRFLTVKSGAKLRGRLVQDFSIQEIFDLGDTKLFSAAVLPVVVIAVKRGGIALTDSDSGSQQANFRRVYLAEGATTSVEISRSRDSILEVLSRGALGGAVHTSEGEFMIERGHLLQPENESVWSLSNGATRDWLKQVDSRSRARFGELGEIKVGIKSTADAVFIRDDWDSLPTDLRPEPELLRPLLTHHVARSWSAAPAATGTEKKVLYPYQTGVKGRMPIELADFPAAAAYLNLHYDRLAGRQYVSDAGRNWYEIWVPQQPSKWQLPKIVWPDISTAPRFFLDQSGAIVNGDCYWMRLREGVDPDWLYLMLAVANSSIATTFYDTVFHNKLYSGRRRFMSQYVQEFPVPELHSPVGQRIVRLVQQLVQHSTQAKLEKLESLVRTSFGLD